MLDSVDYAANAGIVPAIAAIGDKDIFFQAHVIMGKAFSKEGLQMVNLISPGTGHTIDSSGITIISVTGDADCASGNTALPCRVGAGLGATAPTAPEPGAVQFQVIYTPTLGDFNNANPMPIKKEPPLTSAQAYGG